MSPENHENEAEKLVRTGRLDKPSEHAAVLRGYWFPGSRLEAMA